ncbi:membrane protein [Cnuibacter physcomitrellae]|uniref:DUF4396 domain-containing protein n=1 Tax=Cnuibacter physcomitrellae TaxID=1619308 RepID=UPI0019BECAE8|nr:DUF4396 domain-containing protein [Cnuibacter physcomitrellae]GGI42514.1 membrane protein [Cnuibacter physcomitrellae]
MAVFPAWFTVAAIVSLTVAALCAVFVTVDVTLRPQRMSVMNVVWPVTMLFGGLLWLGLYLLRGRTPRTGASQPDGDGSMAGAVAVGASHCGAGCAIGDVIAEFSLALVPGLAAVFGAGTLFQDEMYAAWIADFIFAFGLGIVFQYFAIAPMRNLPVRRGLWEALKADALSITAWQVGMYGVMALAQLAILPALFGTRAAVLSPEFWFVMQIAMLAGFATSYPVNWWLIRAGIKERM